MNCFKLSEKLKLLSKREGRSTILNTLYSSTGQKVQWKPYNIITKLLEN